MNNVVEYNSPPLSKGMIVSAAESKLSPDKMKIGIIGFSTFEFDKGKAEDLITGCLTTLDALDPENCQLVSGLTDVGVPGIAYAVAKRLKWYTIGYASKKASEYKLYPVDEKHIIGDNWGDESEGFLQSIDILIKVGGGDQSKKEFEEFDGPKWELPL